MAEYEDPTSMPSILRTAQEGKAQVDQISGAVGKIMNFIADLIFGIFYFLLTVPPMFVIVFIRYNFGERYLRVLDVLSVLGVLIYVAYDVPVVRTSVGWYAAAYAAASFFHFSQIYERRKAGRRWHSKSAGLPLPIWKRLGASDNPWVCSLVTEPLVLGLVGGIAWVWFRNPLAFLFMISAGSFFVLALMQYYHQRSQLLDAIDKQIEGEEMAAALNPEIPASQTAGFTVPGSGARTKQERLVFAEFYGGLDPKLKELVGVEMKREEGQLSDSDLHRSREDVGAGVS